MNRPQSMFWAKAAVQQRSAAIVSNLLLIFLVSDNSVRRVTAVNNADRSDETYYYILDFQCFRITGKQQPQKQDRDGEQCQAEAVAAMQEYAMTLFLARSSGSLSA